VTLSELFAPSFTGRRDSIALEFRGATYTFGDLDHRSNLLAHSLQARGLKPGDRVSVYLGNSVEIILLYLACIKLGLIFVPMNILYRDREITHILKDAQPALSISDASEITALINSSSASAKFPHLTPDTPAGIIYTSGTTGTSKGAVLTHNNFAVNATALLVAWRISSADHLLLPLPLFHVHGLGNGLHCWLASGCRLRLLDRFDHHTIAQEFLDFRPTLFFGVPAMYVRLLDIAADHAGEIGRAMRLFVSGSAPLSTQIFEEFHQKFGHAILERYGMSETLMNMSNPYDGERRAGTIGLPLSHVTVRLLNPDGQPVADGETGEIYLQGPNIFSGYWHNPEATRAAFRDDYFRTGDLAVRSSDGYYTLCGRKSDLIISGGFNIYPREIEEFLQEQQEVAEAAVVGVPDRVRGEAPVAYVVLRSSIELATLAERCREKLASFKVPREFIPVETLPRNAMGKIQKHLLAASRPAAGD
jgi:malonyl-CoA/methylmalonyl-CoA synthetase